MPLPDSLHASGTSPRLRDLYSCLWLYASGRRATLALAYSFLIVAELVRLAVPWLTGQAINTLQSQGVGGLAEAGFDLLMVFCTIALAWGLHAPGRILERNVALHVRTGFTQFLSLRLMRAPLSWHLQQHSAQTAHRIGQSSEALHSFAETQYLYVQNVVMLLGPLIALWLISPWVGLVALLGFSLLGAYSLGLDVILVKLSRQRNDAERRLQVAWMDTLSHVLTVYALRRFEGVHLLIQKRLHGLYMPLRKIVVLNEVKWASVDVVCAMLWCSLVALYVYLASIDGAEQSLALGSLYMVYDYARRAENVMTVLAGDFGAMAEQQANFGSAEPILTAPQMSANTSLSASQWRLLCLQPSSPAANEEATLPCNGLQKECGDLQLHRGLRYALVGPSGSGKSTLLRILAGLESGASSALTLDGKTVDAEHMRREATLVPQEAQLFVGTIAENLTLGGATSCTEDIHVALDIACATEFVRELPLGLDTPVLEGGGNWSGGQRQRLSLARGLLAAVGSSIVLLDEPTNGLDPKQEAQAMLQTLSAFTGSTMVVALHKLSLLSMFDAVVVMEAGSVIDAGPVSEVLARCALLQELSLAAAGPDHVKTVHMSA